MHSAPRGSTPNTPGTSPSTTRRAIACTILLAALGAACSSTPAAPPSPPGWMSGGIGRLPTGAMLDPTGASTPVGAMPLAMVLAPGGRSIILSLGGWRQQGLQVVDRASGRVLQTIAQPSAFVGLAVGRDGRTVYASGGNEDAVYRYRWTGDSLVQLDSLSLGARPRSGGTRYPAGLALSPDGAMLYVTENLGDSLAVVDLASARVRARVATPRYPYGVVVTPDGDVFVSSWTGSVVSVFRPAGAGLEPVGTIPAGRHPSAMTLDRAGTRLYVASASTDRVTVIDTRARRVIATLHDAPPAAVEGSTPNALALSADERRLYVAEADNNAVAVFDLSDTTPRDTLLGRIPVGWYPTALLTSGDTLIVANGKGRGTSPNPTAPQPTRARAAGSRTYTLGQLDGTLTTIAARDVATTSQLTALSARVTRANGWDRPAGVRTGYPPFEHVIYVIKENRTYDQVLGDLPLADGDTSLLFFPRAVSPNHHALAERFGIYDRFFVNAEVSPDGHNWSTAAYATDYLEKTVPSNYSGRGRSYDYEGTNRGFGAANIPEDDVAEPANGYLWDAAVKAGVSLRNYGEFVVRVDSATGAAPNEEQASGARRAGRYAGNKSALRAVTNAQFPGFDLNIRDAVRADIWLRDFAADVRGNSMPALEIVRLPNDHTAGARAGSPTPAAFMADNDHALGRMVEAVSRSPYWRNTVFFVLEDDAQNGPDHVDSHRSLLLVISAYSKSGAIHRWTNTTDVVATMLAILGAPNLSQFDTHARPLRDIWNATADLAPFTVLVPAVDSLAVNPKATRGARESARLELAQEDRADEALFNRVLWRTIKGRAPYPDLRRAPTAELRARQ